MSPTPLVEPPTSGDPGPKIRSVGNVPPCPLPDRTSFQDLFSPPRDRWSRPSDDTTRILTDGQESPGYATSCVMKINK